MISILRPRRTKPHQVARRLRLAPAEVPAPRAPHAPQDIIKSTRLATSGEGQRDCGEGRRGSGHSPALQNLKSFWIRFFPGL